MTCIIGFIDRKDKVIYMAGDSAGVDGYKVRIRKDPKVFVRQDFIFGFTTSFRMGQLLQTANMSFTPYFKFKKDDPFGYMVAVFIPWVRQVFKDGGYTEIDKNTEMAGDFIVGFEGHLYHIGKDFMVGEMVEDYFAVGCGESLALGSLFSTEGQSILKRINLALEAAEKFSSGVRGPFNIVELRF